jgi:hypothetical protein
MPPAPELEQVEYLVRIGRNKGTLPSHVAGRTIGPMQGPAPHEADFLARLKALDRDSRAAAVFVFSGSAFNHIAGSDPDLLDRLQPHAGFWNAVSGAFQAAAISALGRMYDNRRDSHHIGGLLVAAEDSRGVFASRALRDRRIAAGMSPSDAAAFAASATVQTAGEFEALRREFEDHRELYRHKVKDIRDNMFAHSGRLTPAQIDELFAGLPVRDYEKLTVFPLRLHDALWHAYQNGHPLSLRAAPTNVVEIARTGKPSGLSTWEHVHAVANVSDFLRTLK